MVVAYLQQLYRLEHPRTITPIRHLELVLE